MEKLKAGDMTEINLAPRTEAEDVKQCIAMICNTTRGSVPFMRGVGISGEFMHQLTAGNENNIAEDVADQIHRFEDRVEPADLEFEEESENGGLAYTVPYNIISEVNEND